MARYVITLILVGLLGNPWPVLASGPEAAGSAGMLGAFAPRTGAWSEYGVYENKTGRRTTMRMAIVGVEDDSYWYEMLIRDQERTDIVKMMVAGNPNNPENIRRIIVKTGDKRALELDRDSVEKVRELAGRMFEQQAGLPGDIGGSLRDIETGEGEVTVPAGTFEVKMHQVLDTAGTVYAEYKYAEEVRPFGIVTLETDLTTMVLTGHGDQAQSLISEEAEIMGKPAVEPEELFREIIPEPGQPREMKSGPGSGIRQIPGMGTGYEPDR